MVKIVPAPAPVDPAVSDARSFGAMIRAARTACGMSLDHAALAMGLSKQTLHDLETAKASVGLFTALRVADELGVSLFAVTSDERVPMKRAILETRDALRAAQPPIPSAEPPLPERSTALPRKAGVRR